MKIISIKILYIPLFYFFWVLSYASEIPNHKIAVLVNDDIITTYDINQRIKINIIINRIDVTPQNIQILEERVISDLIDESLKYNLSMENEITVDEKEYLMHEERYFAGLPFTQKELIETFKKNKIRYLEFKNYLIGEIAWNKLIGNLFFRVTSVSDFEVDEIISKNPNINIEQAKDMVIQKQLDLRGDKLLRDMRNEATIEYKL